MTLTIATFLTIIGCSDQQRKATQQLNKNLNGDSLLNEIVKGLPKEKKDEVVKMYNEGSDETKAFLVAMLSMPRSSKKEQIENFEKNKNKIIILKSEYEKLVPDSLIVMIEFNPNYKIVNTDESIDLRIMRKAKDGKNKFVAQNWDLGYNSDDLNTMLKKIGWEHSILPIIKKLLSDANCISIENGAISTIGFARSGMGKYCYKVFEDNLDDNEQKTFNDGCNYIFYKDNIVLEYGGGAVGPQCFPDGGQ
jgi:hypothetical protein